MIRGPPRSTRTDTLFPYTTLCRSQAIGLGLVVGGDLERERLAVLERRASVQADAGDARHGELDGQYVALLAGRKIPRRAVDRPHGAVREGFGIEGRGFERGAVEPEADRVRGEHLNPPKLVDWYGAGQGFAGVDRTSVGEGKRLSEG